MKTKKEIHLLVKDHLVSDEVFELRKLESLEILKTCPQPADKNLEKYYQSEAYISHTDSSKGLFHFLYQWVKKRALRQKLDLIEKLQQEKGSLLDIGSGTGEFLRAAKNRGWKVRGSEPNKKARELSIGKELDVEENISTIQGQFEVITLWHVLEHIPDLEETIERLHTLLTDNGLLIIAVPNYKSYDARYYKTYWAAYDVPRHLWHFSREGIITLLSKKWQLVKTRPMFYDAFYVSLLSEKYRTGNSFSINGCVIGFISNLKAIRSKEYSSLIYCFRKA